MTTDELFNASLQAIRQGAMSQAESWLQQIVALEPHHARAWNLLGGVLAEQGQVEAAVQALREAQRYLPDDPDSLASLAALLYRLGREDQGINLARQSIAIRPDDARVHMILAEALLRRGDFEEGWIEYEWRRQMSGYEQYGRLDLPRPQWDGSDLAGKTILIHAEQGLGDMILMIRYVPLLAARGARVVIECEPALESLLARMDGASVVIPRSSELPEFDLHCPVMSLPRAFGATLATIPANVPYLYHDVNQMHALRLPAQDGMSVGIVWSGGPLAGRRKCPPALFARLMKVPGVRWVSLQMPGPHVDPFTETALIDSTDQLRSLDDTAALIAQLDLVISIDSVVAHLAGAMGEPTWMLLTHAADWRWLKDRADSPWYPTMRLFRQPARGDWDSVAETVEQALIQAGSGTGSRRSQRTV